MFTLQNYITYTPHIKILNLQYTIYILAILLAYNFIPYFIVYSTSYFDW